MKILQDKQFEKYRKLIYDSLGIYMKNTKREMMQSKVFKLMKKANINCYDDYFSLLKNDNSYWSEFIDEITVHKTDFFRENNHFIFIREKVNAIHVNNPRIMRNREIRVWSAGCSTGEEAYSITMVLKECLPEEINIRVLATDISSKVVSQAQKGIYPLENKENIDELLLHKYCTTTNDGLYITSEIKKLITFRTFNLINPFPFKNTFDIIFCRNVMIYFDNLVQQQLIQKYYDVLAPGGLLFIGHSESLTGKEHRFKYIQPTIYRKDYGLRTKLESELI